MWYAWPPGQGVLPEGQDHRGGPEAEHEELFSTSFTGEGQDWRTGGEVAQNGAYALMAEADLPPPPPLLEGEADPSA